MDVRSREAALKRRNDELDACQILCGDDSSAICIQNQDLSPLISQVPQDFISQANLEVDDTNCLIGEKVAENCIRLNIFYPRKYLSFILVIIVY